MTEEERRREALRMTVLDEIDRLDFSLHEALQRFDRLKQDVTRLIGGR